MNGKHKRGLAVLFCAMLFGLLAGCRHEHLWIAATCTAPKTCAECNETEGEPLGHKWEKATCTEPETCSSCDEARGEALGHTIETWNIVSESSCTEAGVEAGACTACGKTIERSLSLKEHTPGEWVTSQMPTETSEGTRTKSCTVCNVELEKEKFSMSAEELKKRYIDQCQRISYDSLSRTPDKYKGERVKFRGKVVQVCSEASSALYYSTYRVATSGSYDNVVYIYVDNYGSGTRILEDDWITFYGEYDGLYSYTTVMGATLTIPSIKVEYID